MVRTYLRLGFGNSNDSARECGGREENLRSAKPENSLYRGYISRKRGLTSSHPELFAFDRQRKERVPYPEFDELLSISFWAY